MPLRISLPHRYEPRPYQLPIHVAMDLGINRIAWVAHRRSGKDKTCINIVPKQMMKNVGAYYYLLPQQRQARKVVWDGIGSDGMRYLDHFPDPLIEGKRNETEMKIRFKNGSLFQLNGTDNIDAIVGTNPRGVIFSEYSIMDPLAWRRLRPILAENGGFAIFIYTPRGENHGYQLWNLANQELAAARRENRKPSWYARMDTAGKGTFNDTGAIPQDVLDQERREIIHQDGNDAFYQQEYECNFSVPLAGAYYAAQIMRAYQEGRVGRVPYNPRFLVDTWWDLGVNDRTAIWFTQTMGATLHVIHYYENTGQGLDHYAKYLQERRYTYGINMAPHDIKVREFTSGRERIDAARQLGLNFQVAPKISIMDGIDSGRALMDKCWFDAESCADGLNALKSYRKEYDEDRKTFLKTPYHDWSSNGADAWRTLAVGIDVKIDGYRPAKRDAWDPDDTHESVSLHPDAV